MAKLPHWNLSIIPNSSEKYTSLTAKLGDPSEKNDKVPKLVFLDSYSFLPSSLAKLADNLETADFVHTSLDGELRKGVFPYTFFTSIERLKNTTCIPPKSTFFNDLTKTEITDENYQRAIDCFTRLGCTNMYEYLLHYLKLDVTLLADIFTKFRKICLTEDGLDPVHYLTLPHYSWDCALKSLPCKLSHLPSQEFYEFFQSGVRGGLTFVNKHVAEDGDFLYVDANNLYGHALSFPLPCSEFEFVTLTKDELLQCDEWGEYGYTAEVDLHYTEEAKLKSFDFPFAPEKVEIPSCKLSTFMHELHQSVYDRPAKSVKGKLMMTHMDKNHYVVHLALLKFYIAHGMEITRVHRVCKYKQAKIFESYIAYNSTKRQNANNEFEKDFFKLKNNCIYGKSVQNPFKKVNFRLVNDSDRVPIYTMRPDLTRVHIFSSNLYGFRLQKTTVLQNKTSFVGQSVLDISKLIMYRSIISVSECRIQSRAHDVSTINLRKRALSSYEDKRLWTGPNESMPYS